MPRRKYYRNKKEIAGQEPESLWYCDGEKMVLVNQDEFVSTDPDPGNFYRVILTPDQLKRIILLFLL